MTNWIHSEDSKPEKYKVVHAVTKVVNEFDIVEAWWTGEKWIVPSVRSSLVSSNVILWQEKPKIPFHLIKDHHK